MQASLLIEDLITYVHLGVSDEEKENPQKVQWNIEIIFSSILNGCLSDELKDTVCYNQLVNDIDVLCRTNHFNLIERLCYEVYSLIKEKVNQAKIRVRVTKVPSYDNTIDYKANFTIKDA